MLKPAVLKLVASAAVTCSGVGNEVISFRLGNLVGGVAHQRQILLTARRPAFPGVMGRIA